MFPNNLCLTALIEEAFPAVKYIDLPLVVSATLLNYKNVLVKIICRYIVIINTPMAPALYVFKQTAVIIAVPK